ncbi:MAG: helix-turn-helix domain-containing protein [Oscillospiraceae bacterium]|nr:helix-turn-helix domain-containing protein [Oscillospiraceae bacterium]
MLSLHNTVGLMSEERPVRVSTQTVRDSDFSHFHEIIQLCFVLSGELRHIIDGKEYIQTSGTCAFILPYMSHILDSKTSDDTPVIVYVWFPESFITDFGADFFSYTDAAHFEGKKIPVVTDFGEDCDKASAFVRKLVSEFNRGTDMSLDAIRDSIASLFRLACREKQNIKLTPVRRKRFEKLWKSVSHIRENYRERLDIDFLAGLSGMPRRTFTENFRKLTGFSPNMYLISVRLAKAVTLFGFDLLHEEIAKESGLSNHANLARTFRKYLEISPSEYFERHLLDTSIHYQKSLREKYPFLAEERDRQMKTPKA